MFMENSGKPQLGDHLTKAVRPVIASNGLTYRRYERTAREGGITKEIRK